MMRPQLVLLLLIASACGAFGFAIGNEALLIERAKTYAANPTPDDLADEFIFRGKFAMLRYNRGEGAVFLAPTSY